MKKLQLTGVMLGAALTATSAMAMQGSCGAGKCGGGDEMKSKKMMKQDSECHGKYKKLMMEKYGIDIDKDMGKKDMKSKKMSGSCGAGKCGGDTKPKAKVTGSCGAGKCG